MPALRSLSSTNETRFQLHTRSIQLSQIIGTTYSYIYFIFILNHTLTKVTQLGVVLSLVNITDEIRILIGCIKRQVLRY